MRVNGFETITVGATAIGPAAASLAGPTLAGDTTRKGMSANYAFFGPLETAEVRWRDDGTAPTSSVGHLMAVGAVLIYDGDLSAIKFIRTGSSGALPATYYRRPN